MGNKLLATDPRPTPQKVVVERVVEQLGLIEPRGMRRGRAGPPPSSASLEIGSRRRSTMAGAAIVDQEHASEPAMPLPEPPQLLDVVLGIVGSQAHGLHSPAVDDQEVQEIDGAMPGGTRTPAARSIRGSPAGSDVAPGPGDWASRRRRRSRCPAGPIAPRWRSTKGPSRPAP